MRDSVPDSLSALGIEETWTPQPQQNSQVQCAVCGSPDVVGVCHHCHRYLCADHIAHPAFYQQKSWEFKTLVASPHWARAVHCAKDAHFVFAYRRMIVLPAMIALLVLLPILLITSLRVAAVTARLVQDPLTYSVWITWFMDAWFRGRVELILATTFSYAGPMLLALFGVVISAVTVVVGERLYQKRGIPALECEGMPLSDIPYLPEHYRIDIKERVNLDIRATAGRLNYHVAQGKGHAEMMILRDASMSEVSDAYNARARKRHWSFERLPNWDFGYVALELPSTVVWTLSSQGLGPARNLFSLQPANPRQLSANSRAWKQLAFDQSYDLTDAALFPGEGTDGRPFLRVLPVLQPLSAGRTVQLLFDLSPALSQGSWTINDLKVNVPTDAFEKGCVQLPIEDTNGFVDAKDLLVHWSRLPLKGTPSQVPTIAFSNPVPSLRVPLEISFEVEGDCALSNLVFPDGRIWYANGERVDAVHVIKRHTTIVHGTATIDPSLLSFQCELATDPITETIQGLSLSPTLLSGILSRLAAQNITIHAVTQNGDTISAVEGQRIVSWDIWGRQYVNVYPMDVHLVMTSRSPLNGGEPATSFTVTGRVLMNNRFSESETSVQDFAEKLSDIISAEMS